MEIDFARELDHVHRPMALPNPPLIVRVIDNAKLSNIMIKIER